MRTILFFDRGELTYLYARISKYIQNLNVVHVAYSNEEVKALQDFGIKPDFIYLDLFRRYFDCSIIDQSIIREIDGDIVRYSKQRFNLNSSIQSDRGFTLLSYKECLRSAIGHYRSWEHIFKKHHVDLFLHEPCSLFFNHIASILCLKQGGNYIYHVQVENDADGYFYLTACNDEYDCQELHLNYEKYKNNPDKIDRERCKAFLDIFRKNYAVFFSNISMRKSFGGLLIRSIKTGLRKLVKFESEDRIYKNIDYWMYHSNESWTKVKNIIGYKIRNILFCDSIPEGEKYYFYPMHLEPEAVVLYMGDGIYKNQVKLIENIAASLPPDYYLYVKDHPHEYAYRAPEDYERLMKVPNIRLLNQSLSGKAIINNAKGVITINGTAGFEGLLMGKQVFCFGKSFYSFAPHVKYIKNIRDLRDAIYSNQNSRYDNDEDLYPYIMALFSSSHKGYIDYFMGRAESLDIDQDANALAIASDIENYAKLMCKEINKNTCQQSE